ncbi:Ribonuclease H2 subunit B [Trinorchestia longiramus]|nr:Ribonuclease H2 subunit B [Trinorchestia longiramus]
MSPKKRNSRSSAAAAAKATAPQSTQKVFFIHDEFMKSSEAEAVLLRHPRTESPAIFLITEDAEGKRKIAEINAFDEGHRSWFMGQSVVSDGKLHLVTPCNPVYLLLPYLMKSERNVPLDQLLDDAQYPAAVQLASCSCSSLNCVADAKGPADLNVWRYNEEKTLQWLERRTRALADLLMAKKLPTTTAQALTFVRTMDEHDTKDAYLQLAHGIISDYLPASLSQSLRTSLKLVDPASLLTAKQKAKQDPEGQKDPKKLKLDGPLEDYSASPGAAKKASPPMSAKAKALARSAVGSKSILSFFGKKPTAYTRQDNLTPLLLTSNSQSGPYRHPGGVEEMQGGGRRVRLKWGAYITA